MYNNYNKKLLQITVKYSKTIKWMLFGHHHTDTFHIVKVGKRYRRLPDLNLIPFQDSEGKPVQVMLMAPSVTPWFSDLEGAGSNNPAFRVIDYNPKTWDYNEI